MSVIARQELIDNKWVTWVALPDNNCVIFETDTQMTEEEAQAKLDEALTPPEEENGSPDQ